MTPVDFLRAVVPSSTWGNVVAIHPDGARPPAGLGFRGDDDMRAVGVFLAAHEDCNQYWSVNPLRERVDKKPTKADVAAMAWAHVDIDRTGDDVLEALRAYRPRPTIIIASGGGFQAFWKLQEPISLADNIAALERLNQSLIAEFGGDRGTHNLDRLMRLPGTMNWPTAKKRAAGRVPVQAQLVEFDETRRYALEAFALLEPPPQTNNRPIDRSADLLRRIAERVRAGAADEAIHAEFVAHPHVAEKTDAVRRRAIDRCIARARDNTRPMDQAFTVEDFYAYSPEHKYLCVPTRALWPAASVNARLPLQDGLPPSVFLDRNRALDQMTWHPGEPGIIRDRLVSEGGWIEHPHARVFNQYRPPLLQVGDAARAGPWLDLVRATYPAEADHIIGWLAHRVQFPGEKINHAIVLGGAMGIGKDTILEPVKQAIGPWNFIEVSPAALLGRFNPFVKAVILRVSEARDLGDVNRFAFYEHMKIYEAAPPDVLRCDEKNIREHYVFNVMGVVITTNHKLDGIFLPPDDRRHFVAWSEKRKEDYTGEDWNKLWGWYASGGTGHVAAYLAGLDLASFDPKADPPKTDAFWEIVNAHRSPEDAQLMDVIEAMSNPAVFTLKGLAAQAWKTVGKEFADWLRDRRNARLVPHRLEAVGYIPVRNEGNKRDGLWKVAGSYAAIYGKATLARGVLLDAAQKLVEEARNAPKPIAGSEGF